MIFILSKLAVLCFCHVLNLIEKETLTAHESRPQFWSYRRGDSRDTERRDCFLKAGTPGRPCMIYFIIVTLLLFPNC